MKTCLHHEIVDGFNIHFYTMPEDMSPIGNFASGDEAADQEIIDKINDGTYTWFIAQVTASKEGIELGCDYLGGCCYNSEEEFYTKYKNDYYADMVKTAISEAKAKLAKLCAGC